MAAEAQELVFAPVTVAQILDRYEAESMSELAPRTAKDYRRHLKVLHRTFGHLTAADLKPKDFAAFLDVRGRGRIQRVRVLAVLSAAFTQAVSTWYWLDRNVLRDVKRPRSKPRDRLILSEEFTAVRACANRRMKLAMTLALITGQRQGDLIRFKWSDIRDDALHVEQSKTGKRIAIEINPELEAVLDECWKLKGAGDTILQTRLGAAYTSEGFRACWQRTIKRALRGRPAYKRRTNKPIAELASTLRERFTFHDIRALAATRCSTPEVAMRLLGHTTLAMTMRVYRRGIERVKALEGL